MQDNHTWKDYSVFFFFFKGVCLGCSSVCKMFAYDAQSAGLNPQSCINQAWLHTPVIPITQETKANVSKVQMKDHHWLHRDPEVILDLRASKTMGTLNQEGGMLGYLGELEGLMNAKGIYNHTSLYTCGDTCMKFSKEYFFKKRLRIG